jgi:hypothetical protein
MFVIVAALLISLVFVVGTIYVRGQTRRVVRCPDTGGIAQVETGTLNEVLNSLFRRNRFRVEKCTRWPEQSGCAETCLSQIEAAPVDCRLRTIVRKWYDGRSCSLCHKPIVVSGVLEGSCAVMDPDGRTRDWSDLTDEELARVLTVYEPVCWDCHMDATFQRVSQDADRMPAGRARTPA